MRKDIENEIRKSEKLLSKKLQKELKKERELINCLDNSIAIGIEKVNCFKCKYMILTDGVKHCKYRNQNIKVTYRSCRYYHRKHTLPKTKRIAIENWNKYLNNAYYEENKEKLSKSQLKKVETWRATHKTF